MAEMLIQSESLTSIADGIRVLSGTEDAMGLDAMATHVNTANNNVSTEADLIAQIQTALEGKAAGGSGGTVETCTVTVTGNSNALRPINIAYMTIDDIGNVVSVNETVSTLSVTVVCLRGSVLSVKYNSSFNYTNFTGGSSMTNAEPLFYSSLLAVYKIADDAETASIQNQPSTSGGSG